MLIFVFFGMSIISVKQDLFRYTSYAFGLDYSSEDKIEYNVTHIKEACTDQSIMTKSKEKYILLLDKWKSKQKNEKPKTCYFKHLRRRLKKRIVDLYCS